MSKPSTLVPSPPGRKHIDSGWARFEHRSKAYHNIPTGAKHIKPRPFNENLVHLVCACVTKKGGHLLRCVVLVVLYTTRLLVLDHQCADASELCLTKWQSVALVVGDVGVWSFLFASVSLHFVAVHLPLGRVSAEFHGRTTHVLGSFARELALPLRGSTSTFAMCRPTEQAARPPLADAALADEAGCCPARCLGPATAHVAGKTQANCCRCKAEDARATSDAPS